MPKLKFPFGLRMAKKGFFLAKHKKKPVGCAYVVGSKVIIGSNDIKTAPIAKELGHRWERIHAEVNVLKFLPEEDLGGTLFVYRQKKDGSLGLARPCDSCMVLIRRLGIRKIVYTTNGGFAVERLYV